MFSSRDAGEILRAQGLRRTRGRVRLLEALIEAARPLSHTDIMEALKGEAIDRVSVYRNLETFVGRGIVHRALVDGRTSRFETSDRCSEHACHPHFTCVQCGKVECLPTVANQPVQGLPEGYVLQRRRLLLQGLCPRCARVTS